MNNDRTDYLINRILSGILLVYHQDKEYELRPASPTIKYKACLLYDNVLNDEKYNTWIREINMEKIMIQLGLWHEDNSKAMTKLENNIEDDKLKLYESLKRPDVFKATRKALDSHRKQLNRLSGIKNEFRNNTLEGYAEAIKSEFIICNTLYCDNKRIFDDNSIKSNNKIAYDFFNSLVQKIYQNTISNSDIRELSRSSLWRTFWNSNKENIFPGAVSEWTDDQRSLVNYSRMYDNVYENPDCPDDKVIEDDDILDGWFIFQKKKRDREKKQANSKSFNSRNSKLDSAQEVFLMVNPEQSAEEIMELNDASGRARLKQKLAFLDKAKGGVKDSELPDVKMDIMNQRAEMKRNLKR